MGASYSSTVRKKERKLKWVTTRQYEKKVECGDIVLLRQYDDMAYGLTHPGISRGMVAHIKGHFDTDLTVNLEPWTSVGIIYRLSADRDIRHLKRVHKSVRQNQVGIVKLLAWSFEQMHHAPVTPNVAIHQPPPTPMC